MRSLIVGLCAGCAAAILDVLPMFLRKMPARSIASAAFQCLVLGLVIAHLKTALPSWANGLAAGLLSSVPIVILVAESEPASAVPILATQAVLGTLCGLAVGKLG